MPHLAELVANAKAAVESAQDIAALDNVRVEYLGKKGHLTLQMTTLRELPAEERPAAGAVMQPTPSGGGCARRRGDGCRRRRSARGRESRWRRCRRRV